MAFHVACPITCKRICFCTLGFPRSVQRSNARNDFVHDVVLVEEFLKDPWGEIRVSKEESTVQVLVPEVPQAPPPAAVVVVDGPGGGVDAAEEAAAAVSALSKRVALQRKAATAMVAAEDYALRFESGDVAPASKEIDGEEQGQSNANVMCRLCFVGENGGSERARRMLSCKSCGKKYHRNCLKNWAQNRDLFHWSSWKCPSCRICEICRRTGDPNKFMFCRRCDAAYHCYCQHPPHKNVSSGPYLCPKHTKCHSCGSNVPGNGLSLRWFLGYTCCDACGRLFVKGNYCPVCLKVYRDSESTPMVCCDVCQRWVHCQCDDISDEKYMQFQVDGNLQYSCPTCRGECYQVRDLEDAVRELWRRKDMADKDLVASLRAAAGLPTEDEIFSLSSYSDDEENGPVVLKNEFGRSLKLSLKVDKLPKKAKEHGKKGSSKKYPKKKGYQVPSSSKTEYDLSFEGYHDVHSHGNSFGDDMHSPKVEGQDISSSFAGVASHTEGVCSINQLGVLKHKYVDEVMASDDNKISRVKFKTSKPHDLDSGDDDGKHVSKSKIIKAKKLVINLGARKINVTNSPRSNASSCQREPDLMTSNGIEDTSLQKMNSKFVLDHRCESRDGKAKLGDGDRVDHASQGLKIAGRGGNVIKFGRVRQEVSNSNTKVGSESSADGHEPDHMHVLSGKRNNDRSRAALGKQLESRPNASGGSNEDAPVLQSLAKDSKPSLKLKFRKLENQNSQVPQPEEEKSLIKGQRSKRKRPSPFMEKTSFNEDEDEDATQSNQDSLMNEIMDANWILKKLGKDSIGKRVEVHQPSDNSWHKGVVTDTVEGTSALAISLDNGRMKTLELGKQGVRFVPQKKKRSKS